MVHVTYGRVFAQHSDDPVQLVEEKKIRGPAGELNDEPPEHYLIGLDAESHPHDTIRRIFRNVDNMPAAKFRPQRLSERGERNSLLLKISQATFD